MEKKDSPTLQSKGWRGFRHVYFRYCRKQFKHSFVWSCCAVAFVTIVACFSGKSYFELLVVLSDIGIKVAPPLLGFTLSGYSLIVGVNDVTIAEKLKSHKTKFGITMYQLLYTSFIAMLGSIFLLLIESVVLHYVIEADLSLEVPMIVDVINIIIFLGYSLTMFYALFAVKDLLSNLFSLGQTANNIYQVMHMNENNKNILFLMKGFGVGGQEVVTSVLSKAFLDDGYGVSIVFLSEPHGLVFDNLDERIKKHIFEQEEFSLNRIHSLRDILVKDKIDIVVNQWGLPFAPAFILKHAIKGMNIKVISVYHNQPNINARLKGVELKIDATRSPLSKFILHIEKQIFGLVTKYSMRYVYHNSDSYLLLSNRHIEDFKNFTRLSKPSRIRVITNPITVDSQKYVYSQDKKLKEIIYVGRIDINQKRAFRLADVWHILEEKMPDWKFTVIGKGDDFEEFRDYVKRLGLRHIYLEGFKNPKEYYERASFLILTSEYEGLPLILAEAMSYGVIPVVYGSFSSVYDVIDDGKNGIIVPYNPKGFDPKIMANAITAVVTNTKQVSNMALSAIDKSKEFNIEPIVKEWEKLFNEF